MAKANFFNKLTSISNIFGLSPFLLVDQRKKYYSNFGCLLSLLIYVSFIFFSIYFSSDMIKKENPKIETSTKENNFSPKSLKFSQEKPFYFGIFGFDNKPIDPKLYFDVVVAATYNDINNPLKTVRNEYLLEICTEKHLKMVNSKEFTWFYKMKEYLLCLPDNFNSKVSGYPFSSASNLIEISMKKCNLTINKYCQQNKPFPVGFALISIFDYDVNPSSYKNYQIPVLRSIPIIYSNEMFNNLMVHFQNFKIETEDGLIMENKIQDEFSNLDKYDRSSPMTNSTSHNVLILIHFMMSTKIVVIKRQYKKIQDVLGQIGGILNLIVLAGNILVSPFIELKFYLQIIEKNFKIKMQNSLSSEKNIFLETKKSSEANTKIKSIF